MPRYRYMCEECTLIFTIFHGINEVHLDCHECGGIQSMKKLLSMPIVIKDSVEVKKNKIGELTKEYIEINRKVLQEEKDKIKGKEHDSS